jgi:hypothetical protein
MRIVQFSRDHRGRTRGAVANDASWRDVSEALRNPESSHVFRVLFYANCSTLGFGSTWVERRRCRDREPVGFSFRFAERIIVESTPSV